MTQNRELIEVSIDIDADPQRVWSIVGDLRRMGERSPQCRKMFILNTPVGVGTKTVNINRAGWLYWPTTSQILEFDPGRILSFRVPQNGSVWTYELEARGHGTLLTESRHLPHGASAISNFLTGRVFGGTADFEDNLERGMRRTLAQIKAEAETPS